ncbi:MAG TPA: FkbM family methyltransferase [Gammaproteobacteria bacterium]|nr:FkbM family methyltransferase [Gammaproteobacteria bacterium]
MLDWNQYDESYSVEMKPGFELYLRKNCEYSQKRFVYKVAEVKELGFLNNFDFSNLICFDVGSNIGYWTVYLGRKLRAKQVHCFEPDPKLFSILKKNISLNKIETHTIANEYAICETERNIKLYLLPEHSGDNRSYFVEGRVSIPVKATSIDQYVNKYKISQVDFIKIDIQGGEAFALDGCIETLSRYKPVLMVEFSPKVSFDNADGLRQRLFNLMKANIMSLFVVEKNILKPIDISCLDGQYEGNIFISTNDSWLVANH